MTSLNTFGTISSIILFALISIYTGYTHILKGKNNIATVTAIHRYLLFIAGLFIGIALAGQVSNPLEIGITSNEIIISILFLVAGFFVFLLGYFYINNAIWAPLVEISEYSAEFGTNFIATRLPNSGPLELQAFSKRFNENVLTLANKISLVEIEVENITNATEKTILSGSNLTGQLRNLSDLTSNFSDTTGKQQIVVSDIGHLISNFVEWYDDTQVKLQENFIELRSLSEMGNLIAINAAVEASNLEIPNPGFDILADKLRELGRSLEHRQTSLKRVLEDINIKYDTFRVDVQNSVNRAFKLSSSTTDIGAQVDILVEQIGSKETIFDENSQELKRRVSEFQSQLPISYK